MQRFVQIREADESCLCAACGAVYLPMIILAWQVRTWPPKKTLRWKIKGFSQQGYVYALRAGSRGTYTFFGYLKITHFGLCKFVRLCKRDHQARQVAQEHIPCASNLAK